MSVDIRDVITIGELSKRGLPEKLLRYWTNHNVLGFRDTCTLRIGGRRVINVSAANDWLEQHRTAAPAVQEGA